MKWKDTCSLEEKLWPRQHIKKQRHYFANKNPSSQSYGFSSSHIWIWELDYKESCVLKNWCFWTVLLEKTLESPLDCKEIQPVNPKGNQSWIFTGRIDAEAQTQVLATWCEEVTHKKGPWCWERLKAGREGEGRGWDGWMASPTWCTWVWVGSGVGDGREVWCAAVYGVTQSWTQLSNCPELMSDKTIPIVFFFFFIF